VYPSYYGYYDPYDYYSYGYPGYPSAYPGYPSSSYPAYPYPPNSYPGNPYPSNQYPVNPYPQGGSQGYPPSAYPQNGPPGSVNVQPGPNSANNNSGGVSFEISPATAEVFVDGTYVGTVGEFTPTTQALGLPPGRHRIEIRAPGYRTMNVDADIVVGQVIPYRGQMER